MATTDELLKAAKAIDIYTDDGYFKAKASLKELLVGADVGPKGNLRTRRTPTKGKRKSGVMQFRFRDSNGPFLVEDSGGPGGHPPPETYVQVRTAESNNLYGIDSREGDHKSPNPQMYTHSVFSPYYHGVVATFYPGRSVVGTGYLPWGCNQLPGLDINGARSTAKNSAISDILDQIRGEVDLSIDIAESGKTRTMLMSAYKAMVKVLDGARKLRRAAKTLDSQRLLALQKLNKKGFDLRKVPKQLGNAWLAYTYGIKPAVQSVYGAAELLIKPSKSGLKVLVGKGSGNDSVKKTNTGPNGFDTEVRTTKVDARCTIAGRFDFKPSIVSQLAGFTSLNPVSIAWELTPYSFVVDWFIDIGGYLRAAESVFIYGDNFVNGYMSETARTEWTGSLQGMQTRTDGSGTIDIVSGFAGGTETQKKRTVLTALPFPDFPPFNPRLGSSRLISAAALLGQFLK